MNRIFILILFQCCCCVAGYSFSSFNLRSTAGVDTTKVLFVGNSFIYFYNMPQVVASMINTEGGAMRIKKSTVGGSNLEQHWKQERETQTMRLLAEEKWDYVVFNNHSRSTIETPERFMMYGRKFAEKVKAQGATPIFMITWAYESNPLMQSAITEGYLKLAQETGSEVVPAGPLFEMSRKLRPDLDLFHDDKHQSALGTYLIALAFYKFFTGTSVKGVTHTPKILDQYGESLQLLFISEKDARFLKQLVDEFETSK